MRPQRRVSWRSPAVVRTLRCLLALSGQAAFGPWVLRPSRGGACPSETAPGTRSGLGLVLVLLPGHRSRQVVPVRARPGVPRPPPDLDAPRGEAVLGEVENQRAYLLAL